MWEIKKEVKWGDKKCICSAHQAAEALYKEQLYKLKMRVLAGKHNCPGEPQLHLLALRQWRYQHASALKSTFRKLFH